MVVLIDNIPNDSTGIETIIAENLKNSNFFNSAILNDKNLNGSVDTDEENAQAVLTDKIEYVPGFCFMKGIMQLFLALRDEDNVVAIRIIHFITTALYNYGFLNSITNDATGMLNWAKAFVDGIEQAIYDEINRKIKHKTLLIDAMISLAMCVKSISGETERA